MKKSILLLLGIAIFVTSCKKDDDSSSNTNPAPTPTTCLITKTNDLIENTYSDVVYNTSNLLDNIKGYDSTDTQKNGFNCTYSDGKLTKIAMQDSTGTDTQIFEFVYNGNEVDTVHLYMDNNSDGILDTAAYYLYYYTSTTLDSIVTFYDIGGGNFIAASKYEYTWTGNNITEVKEYELNYPNLVLSKTTTYEFDTKKNYIHNIGLDNMPTAVDMINANNYTKKTVRDASDVIDNDNSGNYFNTYDGDKLTQLIVVSLNNDTIQNEVRTFTCN